MQANDIESYFVNKVQEGKTVEQVAETLVASGWPKEEVERTIQTLQDQGKISNEKAAFSYVNPHGVGQALSTFPRSVGIFVLACFIVAGGVLIFASNNNAPTSNVPVQSSTQTIASVQANDYNLWLCEFLNDGSCSDPRVAAKPTHLQADFNNDGKVDLEDYNAWRQRYHQG